MIFEGFFVHGSGSNIIHELKYWKSWIISDFATTGKGYILTSCMLDALIWVKKLLYRDMLKNPVREGAGKMYEKIKAAPREGA